MTVLSALMDGRMREMSKKKISVPNIFPSFLEEKHTIKRRESVKMLDADLRGRVMETEFFWNTKETFLKKEE